MICTPMPVATMCCASFRQHPVVECASAEGVSPGGRAHPERTTAAHSELSARAFRDAQRLSMCKYFAGTDSLGGIVGLQHGGIRRHTLFDLFRKWTPGTGAKSGARLGDFAERFARSGVGPGCGTGSDRKARGGAASVLQLVVGHTSMPPEDSQYQFLPLPLCQPRLALLCVCVYTVESV